jgi:hypothetical protein
MIITVNDTQQIDPQKVWLKMPLTLEGDIFLVERSTGKQIGENIQFVNSLPYPFQSRRLGNGTPELWWSILQENWTIEALTQKARDFGFRTDEQDVIENGDPGYQPSDVKKRNLFSAQKWYDRHSGTSKTIVIITQEVTDANERVDWTYCPVEDTPDFITAPLDYQDPFIVPETVEEITDIFTKYGFETDKNIVSCFSPEELYYRLDVEYEEGSKIPVADDYIFSQYDTVSLYTKEDIVSGYDLRDHSIKNIPSCFGDNAADNTWEIVKSMSKKDVVKHLNAQGYTPYPE